ncbi:SUKH-4 family immunity protein [Streptomyces cavernicola]|uniref:SUKH-4 family immunity protein n=1 Tax=Streptomyces cavernicola TaxID=3043613 RepID=A0ABT6SG45_9ACTN|nr:SUKH-4 family immunity protein [Streptomyces sp. B-S-A6]MDI3407176.1 SUKH-4 family immunity protein [Streptomyces sp. B-S-A6]
MTPQRETTQEQARAAADGWLNGDAPTGLRRDVRMHEFSLGWVVWAAPPPEERDPVTGERRPPAEVDAATAVVDRRTGELSTWPALPVDEVVRLYEEKHAETDAEDEPEPDAPQMNHPAPPRERPVTGPGNTAVFTYVDPATGEETSLLRTSGPGLAPAETRCYAELLRLNIPPQNVIAVHTDLNPSLLPGGYTGELLLSGALPSAEFSSTHEYGLFAQERSDGAARLVEHVETLYAITGHAPPPRPHRTPLPAHVRPAVPVADEALGRHLDKLFDRTGGVRRFTPEELAGLDLPAATRSTLLVAGLPADVPFFFGAPKESDLVQDAASHLRDHGAQLPEAVLATLAGHVRIGTDGWAEITVQCLGAEEWKGLVWAASPKSGSGRLVNTSVSAFVRSLALLVATRNGMVGMDPYQAGAGVEEFQTRLAAIDARAVEPDNWWATVVDQMWHGLF